MTFTYTEDLTVARDYVRFHTGDTVEDQAFLSDEIITSMIAVEGSNDAAVIAGLRYIVTRLSQPGFSADWLSVDNKSAAESYRMMLREKQREFGLSQMTSSSKTAYRGDSAQTTTPDYEGGRGPGGGDDWDDRYPFDGRYWK